MKLVAAHAKKQKVYFLLIFALMIISLGQLPKIAFADTWSAETSGTGNTLNNVSCVGSNFCKAVGDGGKILSWNGSAWSTDTSGTGNVLYGVSCAGSNFCKAVGTGGTIVSWNGSAWSADISSTGNAGVPRKLEVM